ncbi:MAG TPA: flavin reductase family protein, partial [Paracoccus sp. (in: a-proteobacteria)]|nr:flavin reductase family protein [Paracoccus sp. (in: a-proteobacteria)]
SPCQTIDCLRVSDAAAALECRATRILRLAGEANYMVLGVVTGIHLRDDCVIDGRFDLRANGWLSRLGYKDYAVTTETFEMERP